jgi:hypothetical protein
MRFNPSWEELQNCKQCGHRKHRGKCNIINRSTARRTECKCEYEEGQKDIDTITNEEFRKLLIPRLYYLNPKIKRVYVTRYDYWWSFAPRQWARMVINHLTGDEGYYLDDYTPIKHQPKFIYRNIDGSCDTYRRDIIVVRPIDWTKHDWVFAGEQIGLIGPDEISYDFWL